MTHHLQDLNIHAFRQLEQVELKSLGRVNLLVGINNSGKTSVLEAIAAHCRPLEPLEWINIARQREIKSSREPALDAVRWLFPQRDARAEDPYYHGEVRIEGSGRYANLETRAQFEGLIAAPDEDDSYDDYNEDDEEEESSSSSASMTPSPESEERGANITLTARVPANRSHKFEANANGTCNEQFRLWENKRYVSRTAPSTLRLPVATVSAFEHRVRQFQVSKLSEATLKGQKLNIVELVRQIDSDVEDLEILSRSGIRPTLYVRHRRTGFTPISAFGDGVRRIISIALNLSTVQHGVLLIDEIETAIHKDALTTVFQWLARACKHFDVQLFATTHSLEAIDAVLTAQIDEPNQVVAFHMPGHLGNAIKRFDGEILDNLRFERGLDIR